MIYYQAAGVQYCSTVYFSTNIDRQGLVLFDEFTSPRTITSWIGPEAENKAGREYPRDFYEFLI